MKFRCFSRIAIVLAFSTALTIVSSANALTSEEGIAQSKAALEALNSGNLTKAVDLYDQVIAVAGLPAEVLSIALLNKGLAEQKLNRHDKAAEDYTAALKLNAMARELTATAYYNRGLSLHKIGKVRAAIEDYTQALMRNPQLPHAFMSRGQALRESGQYLFALSDFERAIRYGHPDPAAVFHAAAGTFETLERPNDARLHYQAALLANPDYGPSQARLAQLDQPADAVAVSTEAKSEGLGVVMSQTDARKPDQPTAVAPTEALLAAAPETATQPAAAKPATSKTAHAIVPQAPAVTTAAVQKPIVTTIASAPGKQSKRTKKLYTDRLPAPVEMAQVQKIVPAAVDLTTASSETTGSITPPTDGPTEEKLAALAPDVATDAIPLQSEWIVQLASATSEEGAWSTWAKMQSKSKALKDLQPLVIRADLGTKGVFYRLRLSGFDSQTGAKSACSKLKAKGVTCFVGRSSS